MKNRITGNKYFGNKIVLFICTVIGFAFVINILSSCKKESVVPVVVESGTVTDIDGNVYKTIKIGNQWWMAENLKAKKFRNGVAISQAQSASEWIDSTSAYCIYDNITSAPGLLYNWYAVSDTNNLAPLGWHIPSDEEWKELEKYLGMSQADADKVNWRGTNEGDKLKIEAPTGWTPYGEVWGTNESGFAALAGGCRLFNATWGEPALFSTGFWWSSTENGNEAWYRYLDYKNADVFRFYGSKNYGFSIRCIKD